MVGVLEGQEYAVDQLFTLTNKSPVNETTAHFTFEKIHKDPVAKNLKLWYNDPSMIGKHFLVYSPLNNRVKRHYTICSTMSP